MTRHAVVAVRSTTASTATMGGSASIFKKHRQEIVDGDAGPRGASVDFEFLKLKLVDGELGAIWAAS